jgi:hypothetical protein
MLCDNRLSDSTQFHRVDTVSLTQKSLASMNDGWTEPITDDLNLKTSVIVKCKIKAVPVLKRVIKSRGLVEIILRPFLT